MLTAKQWAFLFYDLEYHIFSLISKVETVNVKVSKLAKRQLAAIMFTDIVGYTSMMHENENAAAEVRQRHRDVFEKEHNKFNGEILQYYGDGTLSVLKSAVEAVECSIAMQQEFQTGQIVPLRIGLHLGDIVFDENDVYGDAVNLASRIETLGITGCVLISERVNYVIKNHSSIDTQSLGYFEFKNIKDPVEVFSISNKGIKVPKRFELKGKLKENKKSVAVLPFVNMSSDPENEYFSDGIAEEILNALVKVEGLQVTARTSSFSFKGKNMDVREIGRQLNVIHILEGSVRKSGNRVRITVQLVSCIDGYHFFSETYDRNLEDIFAVQDEIAQKITNRLREHLSEDQYQKSLVTASTSNMEAYNSYLKGIYHYNRWQIDGIQKAIDHFKKAIQLQPDFAEPYAFMAICFIMMGFSLQIPWKEAAERSNYYVSKAIILKPDLIEAYFAQATSKIVYDWDWKGLEKLIKKMKALDLGRADIVIPYAALHQITGDLETAIEEYKKGLKYDPFSVNLNMYCGIILAWTKKYEEAISYLERALEITPKNRSVFEYLGWTYLLKEEFSKAEEYFQKIEDELGYQFTRSTSLGICYAMQGKEIQARECLEKVLALNEQAGEVSLANDLALLYTWLGDFDKAFEYLDNMVEHKIGEIIFVKNDPKWGQLRNDERFKKIIKKVLGEYV